MRETRRYARPLPPLYGSLPQMCGRLWGTGGLIVLFKKTFKVFETLKV